MSGMPVGSERWIAVVARLFGVASSAVAVDDDVLRVSDRAYPIERDVVLLDSTEVRPDTSRGTGEDVRRSFSEEWQAYGSILPEHDEEFSAYFDIVDLQALSGSLAIDLGCGSGRWSAKLAPHVQTIVLVDFSDAIFVARDNLAGASNAVFFRGDVTSLPFANDSVDFLFSLGVLHHLDRACLPVARDLMRLGPLGLFYLYYALDNRPAYYRRLLSGVTAARRSLGRVESERGRRRISRALAWAVYRPMVAIGSVAQRAGVDAPVPLYESYRGKSIDRIEQDAYDRFFTSIEQRVSRAEIERAFSGFDVSVSDSEPYWHFSVTRAEV
jgi:SAM-dependent methyltransferase